jgi:BirA family biotin operon repressor/biotin-[acetyl-CoA-carboxylase] ligase
MFPAKGVEPLAGDELKRQLQNGIIGREIIVLQEIGSTNDAILQVPDASRSEGLVLFAEHQTAGRGQYGNRWESAVGKGLWFSILLRPEIPLGDSGRLTIWAIEGISHVIRSEFSLEPAIKLPNDAQLYGRKVAGVLVEMRAQQKAPHLAIVGIGINVNQSVRDFPPELQDRAISVAMALNRPVDRQQLAVAVLRNLDRTYCEKFVCSRRR